MAQLPEKFLRITDAVFILPDDFTGNLRDALTLFLEYHANLDTKRHPPQYVDPEHLHTPLDILTNSSNARACVDGTIYELVDGSYIERKTSPEN